MKQTNKQSAKCSKTQQACMSHRHQLVVEFYGLFVRSGCTERVVSSKKRGPPFLKSTGQQFTSCRCHGYMLQSINIYIYYDMFKTELLTYPWKEQPHKSKPEADLSQFLMSIKFPVDFPLFSIPPRLVCAQRLRCGGGRTPWPPSWGGRHVRPGVLVTYWSDSILGPTSLQLPCDSLLFC